jgi:hypothetical protein
MNIHVHHHHPYIDAVSEILLRLDALKTEQDLINRKLDTLMTTQSDIAAALAQLQTAVAAETTVNQSAVTLIQGLAAQIAALAAQTTDTTTATALNALFAQLGTDTTNLATAVTANTPATPVAPTTP